MRLPVPPVSDVVLAGAFLALTVAEAVLSPEVTSPALHIGVAGTAMVALAWRRSYPMAVALVVIASNIVVNPHGSTPRSCPWCSSPTRSGRSSSRPGAISAWASCSYRS